MAAPARRHVRHVRLDGVSLSDILVEERLGVAYDGGARNQAAHEANASWLLAAGRLEVSDT